MHELPAPLATTLADRYRIERELGQGGMATVYLARDLKHEREVALKVLRPELGAVLGADRFLAEIKITARLDHPHILTLIDSGAADGFLYYVLPYVRGESLRAFLDREKQLGVDHALMIARQVAGALDYAHRQGVVHRDIKPENILIQEGEAMLTDFGIALAVKEAGGSRLTETGLSLGTPHYMSPEQATGDRTLDARSDLYSLAAVTYEMLAGEPPMTGPTVQAIIAKLLTEQPVRIRTVRPTVPEGVDTAIARALAKIPADRFASAAEFARALDQSKTEAAAVPAPVARARPRALTIAAALGAVATIAVLSLLAARGGDHDELVALRDRRQLTYTGAVRAPALSPDGKQLAYWTQACDRGECSFAVEVQDVGTTTTRRILEGASAAYYLEWSPDRRNLILVGTIGGRYGSFLVSALGGPPRHLTAGTATFFAGGDSLLIGPGGTGETFTVRIASLDGVARDSIRIPGPGEALSALVAVPGSDRIVAMIIQGRQGLWQLVDRQGQVTDRLVNSCTCGGTASRDALWMTRAGPTVSEAVVRVALDPSNGRFAGRQDTVYTGQFSNVSITADGTQFAVDDGSYSFTNYALPMDDLLAGRMPAEPVLAASSPVQAFVSPDGGRLLLRRTLQMPDGATEIRLSTRGFDGGAETPVQVAGRLQSSYWTDSVTLALSIIDAGSLRFQLVDVRSGQSRAQFDPQDTTVRSFTNVAEGWAWIPARGDRVVVDQAGRRHEISKPPEVSAFTFINPSPDGRRLVLGGWNAATEDSIYVLVVPAAGGTPVRWASSFAETGYAQWLGEGSLLFPVWLGQQSVSLFRVREPGRMESIGKIPHVASLASFSMDLKRATLGWRDYRGDAWMYRVVAPN
jgi:hypothetical protein